MATVIPLTNDPSQQFQVDLEGFVYELKVMYNERADWWVLNIADEAGNEVINGVRMSRGVQFLDPYDLGVGGMTLWDTEPENSEPPTVEDLGERLVLIHFSQAEVDSGTVS